MRDAGFFEVTIATMLALMVGVAPAAHARPAAPAQPAAPPAAQAPAVDARTSEEADARFRKGNELYKQGRYVSAEAELEVAFLLKKSHDIAANLAYAEMKLGKMRDAAEHLSFAVRNWAPTGKEDKRRYAEERLLAAKKEVATLRIRVSAPEAEVLVDGVKVGVSPIEGEVFVDAGSLVIEARRVGMKTARQEIAAAKGSEVEVSLAMEAEPQVTAPPVPQPVGQGEGARVPPGGEQPPVIEETGPRTAVLIAGGATAGAALIAGVIFTVVANGKAADRDELKGWERCYEAGVQTGLPDCAKADDLRGDAAGFGNAAFWSFVGAGVIGAATVGYAVITGRSAERSARPQIVPVVAASGGGLELLGRF